MQIHQYLCAIFVILITLSANAVCQTTSDSRSLSFVQSGQLRVGVGLRTPTLAVKDPKTGELRGPSIDLGKALAAQLGVTFLPVEYPRAGAVLDGLQNNAWDVSFLVFDPKRGEQANFTQPYIETDFAFLIAAESKIRTSADVDQPGIRIAVERGGASDFELTRMLKNAELVRTDTNSIGTQLLRSGSVNARAAPRPVLLAEAQEVPGARVLEEGFALISLGGVVPKENAAGLSYLDDFIARTKREGFIAKMIMSNGLQGVRPATSAKLLQ